MNYEKTKCTKDLDSRARIETTKINKLISHPTIELEKTKSMPKAKTVKNVRITKAIPFRRKRLKEEGRPRGTLKNTTLKKRN